MTHTARTARPGHPRPRPATAWAALVLCVTVAAAGCSPSDATETGSPGESVPPRPATCATSAAEMPPECEADVSFAETAEGSPVEGSPAEGSPAEGG
ncbi:hypothetical protein [Streptomyces sp. NPDC047130]|uniref:hypothetical protein n=1 Tax=Streptomyces sp. NPDC047130 TaxID=3155261 RepID=UPI0033CC32E2